MPPADPSQWLINPYANDGAPESSSARSARAAGRALAVGALGLGAAVAFTGTGLADEENGGGDSTSEVEEFDSSSSGDDSNEPPAGSNGGGSGDQQVPAPGGDGSASGSTTVAEDDRGSGRNPRTGSLLVASSLDDGSGNQQVPASGATPAVSDDTDWTSVDDLERAGGIQEFDASSPDFQAVNDLLQDIESGDAEFGTTTANLGPVEQGGDAPVTQLNTTGDVARAETLREAEQVIALTAPERAAIDTERTQMARFTPDPVTGNIVATVPASTGEPREVAIAPNVTWREPTVTTGDAEFVFDLEDREIGVENLSSNGGQVVYSPPQSVRALDDRGNSRVALGTTITGTLNPQSGQSIYLSGGGDPVDPADRLNIQTATTASASIGTGQPEDAPTGNASSRWDTLALTGGLNTNLDLTNGENNVVPSGSVAAPIALTASAGANDPNSRWDATASVGATPQFTFGPDAGVDPQLDLTAQVGAGGEIGDRRDADGNFYDTDGDGLTPGSVAWGRLGGQWQSTTSGVVPLTAATGETVNATGNTSSYNLGGEVGFSLREDRPRWTAEGTGRVGAGIQESSATVPGVGTTSTGTNPYVNATLDGSVQARTAPRDQSHLFAGANANVGFNLANGESTTSASITPQVGGRLALGSSAITADGGYRLGTNPGPTVGVGGEFNLFGGRAAPEVRYTGGENSAVAVNLRFIPQAEVRAPEPPPLQQIDPPAAVASAPTQSAPTQTVTNTTADSNPLPGADLSFGTSPADLPPIPRGATGAAALEGTVPRGIDLTPAPSVSPQSSLPATTEIGPRSAAPTPDEGLNISLDKSVVDIPSPTVSSLPEPSSSLSVSSVPDLTPPAPSVSVPDLTPSSTSLSSLPDLTPEASPALALGSSSIDPPSISSPSFDAPSITPPPVSTPSVDLPSSSSSNLPSGFGSFTSRF